MEETTIKDLLINEQIFANVVRLIDENGEQLGVMPIEDARKMALETGLDLVLIANGDPKVCKIMDYGKHKFETQKKEKEARKNQKVSELKEVQLSMTIADHDMQTKAKHANRFLTNGDKVKVVLRLRGRQRAFIANCLKVVDAFFELVKENGTIDKPSEVAGRNIIMIVKPKK